MRTRLTNREDPIGVSDGQLKDWRDWGLLVQDADGLWDANTVEKVVRIHELGKTLDAYPRRVIFLNAETFRVLPPIPGREADGDQSEPFFHIPPECLRRAMSDVAPRIRPHLSSMKRVDAAVMAIPLASREPDSIKPRQQKSGKLPPREEWVSILESASADEFATRVGFQYYVAALLRQFGKDADHDLSDIPFDYQIVLLTIRDLEARRRLRAQKTRVAGQETL